MVLMLGLSACNGKNEEMPATGGLDNAEQLVAGTYTGTWTKQNLTTGEVESTPGSIVFSWTEDLGNNVTAIQVASEASGFLNLNNESARCNVSRLSSGVLSYWNVYDGNPFGLTFTGKVSPEGVCTMEYIAVVIVKRKETQFQYTFSGNKQ